MPCNADYLDPTQLEQELSRVACLLDEIAGKPCPKHYWDGSHPRVFGAATPALGDQLVRELCEALKDRDVTACSLEMQLWWRDHQAADAARLAREHGDEPLPPPPTPQPGP